MKKHKILITSIVVFFLFLVTYLILTMDYFSVKKIKVYNNKLVTKQELNNITKDYIGQNIFRLKKNKLSDKLVENSYIKNAEVKKVLPNLVEIKIQETKDICYFEIGKDKFFVDTDYNVVKNKNRVDYTKLPKIVGANQNIEKISNLQADKNFYLFIKNLKEQKVLNQLNEINVDDVKSIFLNEKKGILIEYGDLGDSEKKSIKIFKILKQIGTKSINVKTVNVSDIQRPFFTIKDDKQTEE